jgi:hypothetical protein
MLLRCESLEPPMSQLGQKRSHSHVGSNVWFARKRSSKADIGRLCAISVIAAIRGTDITEYWSGWLSPT